MDLNKKDELYLKKIEFFIYHYFVNGFRYFKQMSILFDSKSYENDFQGLKSQILENDSIRKEFFNNYDDKLYVWFDLDFCCKCLGLNGWEINENQESETYICKKTKIIHAKNKFNVLEMILHITFSILNEEKNRKEVEKIFAFCNVMRYQNLKHYELWYERYENLKDIENLEKEIKCDGYFDTEFGSFRMGFEGFIDGSNMLEYNLNKYFYKIMEKRIFRYVNIDNYRFLNVDKILKIHKDQVKICYNGNEEKELFNILMENIIKIDYSNDNVKYKY